MKENGVCTSQELWGGVLLPWPKKGDRLDPDIGLSIEQAPQALGNNMEFKEHCDKGPGPRAALCGEMLGRDTGSLSPAWSQVRQQKGTELWEENAHPDSSVS